MRCNHAPATPLGIHAMGGVLLRPRPSLSLCVGVSCILISHAFFQLSQKARKQEMADIEMLLSRSSSPNKISPPRKRNESTCFSDGETAGRQSRLIDTPPPDYERYLSDSELPSARYSRSPRPGFAARVGLEHQLFFCLFIYF